MSQILFHKYEGAGNDFVLIDGREQPLPSDLSCLARKLCNRRMGVGADGVLFLFPHYRMRIFNADGSEPSMCGNGVTCLFDYIRKVDRISDVHIATECGTVHCYEDRGFPVVNLGKPQVIHFPIELAPFGPCYVVNTGVPHVVLFAFPDSIEEMGRKIRFHPLLGKEGANVNFVSLQEGKIYARTYERGVEAETPACGTGAAAVAFVVKQLHNCPSPIEINAKFSFSFKNDQIAMRGHSRQVFSGAI